MKIKIIGKFNAQTFPLDETAIEISEETLEQIGVTKCFDVEHNKVINYEPAKDPEKIKANTLKQIEELKKLLKDSDYKAIKFAEGLISSEEYEEIKAQRQAWRDEINRLEQLI